MDVGQRIKEARLYANLNQTELGKACGVSRAAVSQWEAGTTKSPTSKHIFTIASVTGYDARWLSTGTGAKFQGKANTERQATENNGGGLVPVLDVKEAYSWPLDKEKKYLIKSWEPSSEADSPDVFWLKVKGDSMVSPHGLSFPEGYIIKVNPDKDATNGSLVVARFPDETEVTFKKLVREAGQTYLQSLNPAYPLIPVGKDCEIIGVVTEARVRF